MSDTTHEYVNDDATIAAIATATGRGAIAMIRVSGVRAREIGEQLVHPPPTNPRRNYLGVISNDLGERLDEGVVCFYEAPHSYTGEDMLELSVHGGLVGPNTVLRAIIAAGARLAKPGEFTRRAVLNGKLDLLQAEAVGDLIDAKSSAAHRQSFRQLDGSLSNKIATLRKDVLVLESLLAYDIDFPEEDDGPIPRDRLGKATDVLLDSLNDLIATAPRGEIINRGALVVLAGAPNVGKSSLFNALLGETRAIVTEFAGTTRDAIEAVLDLPELPIRLVDTAGLHETDHPIERLGIEATTRYLSSAALLLVCVTPETAEDTLGFLQSHVGPERIVVGMKADLVAKGYNQEPDVSVSAATRAGLQDLIRAIEVKLRTIYGSAVDEPMLTRARHRMLVGHAHAEVEAFRDIWTTGALPAPIAATHIHNAAELLGELIGTIHVEDILDVVFSSFCVGK